MSILQNILYDKGIRPKEKITVLGNSLLQKSLTVEELMTYADTQKGAIKATCIEALEYATRKNPAIADQRVWQWIIQSLLDKEPRIKWESAKVIGHTARLFPSQLAEATEHLLINATHSGTVVRWATAYALGEIIQFEAGQNPFLLDKVKELSEKEENNGVKKNYLSALKRMKT